MDEAIGHVQQSVSLDPKYALAHANLAFLLRDRGRLAEAIDHLQQAVRLESQTPTLTGTGSSSTDMKPPAQTFGPRPAKAPEMRGKASRSEPASAGRRWTGCEPTWS